MTDGPRHYFPLGGVFIPARSAYLLETAARLNEVRSRARGKDAELDECLRALHIAALAFEEAAAASRRRTLPTDLPAERVRGRETAPSSELLGTVGVADRLRLSPRRVQQLAVRGDLEGQLIGGRWCFTPDAVETFRSRVA